MRTTGKAIRLLSHGGLLLASLLVATPDLAAASGFMQPGPDIVKMLDVAPTPDIIVSPDGTRMVLVRRRNLPGIAERAVPMVGLGGIRVNTRTNGPYDSSGPYAGYSTDGTGFSVVDLGTGAEQRLDVPDGGLDMPFWSPDSRYLAFLHTGSDGISIRVADPESGKSRVLSAPVVNASNTGAYRGSPPCSWMPDSKHLLCLFIPAGRGEAPAFSPSIGPSVQESGTEVAPVRTFTNLLENRYDEELYEYYMTAQPVLIDAKSGAFQEIGKAGIYESLQPSASQEFFLSTRIVRPYSYLLPTIRFTKIVEVLDSAGALVATIANLPVDNSGISMGWASAEPRSYSWMPGPESALLYIEPLDGGIPTSDAKQRDRLMRLDAPFDGDPQEIIRTEFRMADINPDFAARGRPATIPGNHGSAIVTEFDWPSRQLRRWLVNLRGKRHERRLLLDVSTEDWYGYPGDLVLSTNRWGQAVFKRDGNWIFLHGQGGSPEGDHPFLDRYNVETAETQRLFHTSGESFEDVAAVLDTAGSRIVTSYETRRAPPNYRLHDLHSGEMRGLTAFPHPAPFLASVRQQKIDYVRSDGIPLSGRLYLPGDYHEGEALPTVIWAYPREYAGADGAGQVRGSQFRFMGRLSLLSYHLLFVTRGYAVLDAAAMPVVGGVEANDTFVEQLVENADAAIETLVRLGVADRNRIGIGGHSYGAFMAANLLAHSNLFAAGIACSGAYNRSLTPFGFQSERRTMWEAPEVYFAISPFMHADTIKAPLLLIHGDMDSNSGTYTMQSSRMFHALKGHGATARLVLLPFEDHVYVSRESNLHVLWEMFQWFDRFVKNGSLETGQ